MATPYGSLPAIVRVILVGGAVPGRHSGPLRSKCGTHDRNFCPAQRLPHNQAQAHFEGSRDTGPRSAGSRNTDPRVPRRTARCFAGSSARY